MDWCCGVESSKDSPREGKLKEESRTVVSYTNKGEAERRSYDKLAHPYVKIQAENQLQTGTTGPFISFGMCVYRCGTEISCLLCSAE